MRFVAPFLLTFAATPLFAHPHIFVDVGLEVAVGPEGRAEHVTVTWAYDALYSLLVTEDMGLDQDGDMVLTGAEEAKLTGFDMQWIEGFNGDLKMTLDGMPMTLGAPMAPTAVMREGRIVTTHRRAIVEEPSLPGAEVSLKPYDVTFYTAYDVTMGVEVLGLEDCKITLVEPDLDREMELLQAQLAELGTDQDAIEMGFPEVGAAFATDVRITCAAP